MTEIDMAGRPPEPLQAHQLRLVWEGRQVAGVSRIGPLRRTTAVVELREGGELSTSRKLPGATEYAPVVLELGMTHDRQFEQWAESVVTAVAAGDLSFRRDIRIEAYDEGGRLVLAYTVFRCWVSRYEALPDLDAAPGAVLVQHLTLENEGWARDNDVPDPSAPLP